MVAMFNVYGTEYLFDVIPKIKKIVNFKVNEAEITHTPCHDINIFKSMSVVVRSH